MKNALKIVILSGYLALALAPAANAQMGAMMGQTSQPRGLFQSRPRSTGAI
jgi:hypothetical protein